MRELCLELENTAPSGSTAELDGLITKIGVELERVSAVLQQDFNRVRGVAS